MTVGSQSVPRFLTVRIQEGYSLHYTVRAWTGGGAPNPDILTRYYRRIFESLRAQLYRQQWGDYVSYWHDAPAVDVRATFWTRAAHDAWRTMFDGTSNRAF